MSLFSNFLQNHTLHARIQKVLSKLPNSDIVLRFFCFVLFFITFFEYMRGGKKIKITLKAGHHGPTSETPFQNKQANQWLMQHFLTLT